MLEVDSSSALNAIYFWVNQGVLKDLGSGSFETIEKEEGSGTVQQTRTGKQAGRHPTWPWRLSQ